MSVSIDIKVSAASRSNSIGVKDESSTKEKKEWAVRKESSDCRFKTMSFYSVPASVAEEIRNSDEKLRNVDITSKLHLFAIPEESTQWTTATTTKELAAVFIEINKSNFESRKEIQALFRSRRVCILIMHADESSKTLLVFQEHLNHYVTQKISALSVSRKGYTETIPFGGLDRFSVLVEKSSMLIKFQNFVLNYLWQYKLDWYAAPEKIDLYTTTLESTIDKRDHEDELRYALALPDNKSDWIYRETSSTNPQVSITLIEINRKNFEKREDAEALFKSDRLVEFDKKEKVFVTTVERVDYFIQQGVNSIIVLRRGEKRELLPKCTLWIGARLDADYQGCLEGTWPIPAYFPLLRRVMANINVREWQIREDSTNSEGFSKWYSLCGRVYCGGLAIGSVLSAGLGPLLVPCLPALNTNRRPWASTIIPIIGKPIHVLIDYTAASTVFSLQSVANTVFCAAGIVHPGIVYRP